MPLQTSDFSRTVLALALAAPAALGCATSVDSDATVDGAASHDGTTSQGGSSAQGDANGGASGRYGSKDAGGSGGAAKATGGNATSTDGRADPPAAQGGAANDASAGASGHGSGTGGSGASGGSAGSGHNEAGQGGTGSEAGAPLVCAAAQATGSSFTVDEHGVNFTLSSGKMRVEICKEDIMRVRYTSAASIPDKTSLSVSAQWVTPTFCTTESGGVLTIATARMKAKVNTSSGLISYTDANDQTIVSEDSKSTTAAQVEGVSTYKIQTTFNSPADEGLYGLGQHQDGVMNRKGTTERMLNGNGWINIPLLVSNKGYGIFWDNYSTSDFAGNVSNNTKYRYTSEAGEGVDYYFFYGPTIDQVIAGYRATTGPAPLFPKWAYGLFQSKDHYASQSEVLGVMKGYRNAKIPVDVIVQDWNYWDPYSWGSHVMDPDRYQDPATLVDTLHSNHIHGMISIWPLYQSMANPPSADDQDNYKALDALKALYPSGGSHHFYDTFNADARTLVYRQINDRLMGKYGWDAIWADNTEPQPYPDNFGGGKGDIRSVDTALGKGALVINAYPLQHNKALYEGWRKLGPNGKRVYILTRSAFAGLQRYSAACWSGDIQCDYKTYNLQLPAGLNFALAGMPYWTTDIGGYFCGSTNWSSAENSEMFTRWFQFGSFSSMFRIHGQGARELYGTMWNATTKANLLLVDNLRYRLMPYLYSLAWKVTSAGYTIMRHLVFDYPNDTNVLNIKDQFLFGPAILVSPVMAAGATSRSVYLPQGTWYDFWTGSTVAGGAKINASAPLSQIPLHVKAGSIVPMGPMIEYATQSIDPLEIRIYKGQSGSFVLYEDEGDTYNYESGKYSQIPFAWDDAAKTLTIGPRTGSYTGMPEHRTFNVVFVGEGHGAGVDVTATPDQAVPYDGTQVVVNAK